MQLNSPLTDDDELNSFLAQVKITLDDVLFILERNRSIGLNGSFSNGTQTITVVNGLITKVE